MFTTANKIKNGGKWDRFQKCIEESLIVLRFLGFIAQKYSLKVRMPLQVFQPGTAFRPSDRMLKKIKDYGEIFGHIMRKHAEITPDYAEI